MTGASATVADAVFWEGFDPTTLESCSRCSFCHCAGAVARSDTSKNRHALDEQGRSWRRNLPPPRGVPGRYDSAARLSLHFTATIGSADRKER